MRHEEDFMKHAKETIGEERFNSAIEKAHESMKDMYILTDPYGDVALGTADKEEVKKYLRNLLDHEVEILDFTVMLNGTIIPKTILLINRLDIIT